MTTSSGPRSPRGALLTARTIAGGLLGGVAFFAVVAWIVTAGGAEPVGDGGLAEALTYAWIAVVLVGAPGMLHLWRSQIGPALDAPRHERGLQHAARVSRGLIIVWALLEGQALLGIAAFFVAGTTLPFYGGVLVMAVGMAASFPRREWFVG